MNATMEQTETRYYVRCVLDDFERHGQRYRGVPVTWFVDDRDGSETCSVREETMTREEAKAVANYLSTVHGETCELEAHEFDENECVNRTIPYGYRSGFNRYSLHTEPRYDLPFNVCGYFAFRDAEDVVDVDNSCDVGVTN